MSASKLKTLRGEDYRREQLVHVPGLIAMVCVLAFALFLLFPKKAVFSDRAYIDRPDALSIAYLTLLLKSDPKNAELRLALVQQLRVTGQTKTALRVLEPLINSAPSWLAFRVANEHLELTAQLYFAETGAARKLFKDDLKSAFTDAAQRSHGLTELKRVYDRAKVWAEPDQQLQIVEKMIPLTPDLRQKVAWMIEASDMKLAENNPKAAADWLAKAYDVSASYKKDPKLAYRLLNTMLATGKPSFALHKTPYYLNRHPRSRNLLDLAISISRQAGRHDLSEQWLIRATELAPNDIYYNQALMNLQVANGNLKLAARLADKRLKLPNVSADERKKIARLYEWSGQPVKALKQWKWITLNQENPPIEAEKRALKLAVGLARFREATALYERINTLRPLTLAEQKELIGLYIAQGQTDKAEESYRKYLKRHPKDREVWEALAGLQVNLQKLPEAAATYEKIDKQFGLTTKELLDLKNIYWLMDEPEQALAKLVQHPTPDPAHLAEYWKARMDMAWYLEDIDSVNDIYTYVMGLDKKQKVPMAMIEQLMTLYAVTKDYNKSIDMAMVGWQRFHQSRFAVNAMTYASWMKDWKRAVKIADNIEGDEPPQSLKENSQYWLLLANTARELHQLKKAQAYLRTALALSPNNLDIRTSLLWLLIAEHKEGDNTLRDELLDNGMNYGQQSSMWDVLASGWAVLGKYDQAAHWYRMSLPRHQKDWAWLLDFAYALEQSGQPIHGWRVRRYILNLMDKYPIKQSVSEPGRDWNTSYLRLVRAFRGSDWGWKTARKLATYDLTELADSPTVQQRWLELFTEWSLADGNESRSHLMAREADYRKINLPDWQRLGLALQRHDMEVIENLIWSGRPLPLADKTLALAHNGYHYEALNFGLSHLRADISETDQQQLRAITASIRPKQPNGFKTGLYSEQLGDLSLNGVTFRYAHAFDNGVSILDSHFLSAVGSKSLVGQWDAAQRVELTQYYFDREDTQIWNVAVDTRVKGVQPALGFSQDWSLYGGLSMSFSTGWQQRSRISAAAYELANWHYLGGAAGYQWDSRTAVNAQVRWNQFDSLWGDKLGSGANVDVGITYTVFAHAPEWRLRSSVQWMQLNRASALPANLHRFFTDANPGMGSMLTEQFGRIGVGTTLQHGDPGRLTHRVASPHWIADVDVGYQWLSSAFDWGVSGGVGWRLFGDDELAVTLAYASDNQGAGKTYKLWFGYNKYFGR